MGAARMRKKKGTITTKNLPDGNQNDNLKKPSLGESGKTKTETKTVGYGEVGRLPEKRREKSVINGLLRSI